MTDRTVYLAAVAAAGAIVLWDRNAAGSPGQPTTGTTPDNPTRGGNEVEAGAGDPMYHPDDPSIEDPDEPVPGVLTDDEAGQLESDVTWEERNETLRGATGGGETTPEDTQDNPIYHEDDPAIENPDAAVPLDDPEDWEWGV
jgi:hypothetical protein